MTNELKIKFSCNKELDEITPLEIIKNYDPEYDNIISILSDICNEFEESKIFRFNISGFGENNWGLDCRVDLCTAIEELPEFLRNIKSGNFNGSIDLYEQGAEREIIFKDNNEIILVNCNSRTNWKPIPESIFIEKEYAVEMLNKFFMDFLKFAEKLCPNLTANKWFEDWKTI